MKSVRIQAGLNCASLENGLNFRGKDQTTSIARVEEWLFADAITGKKQALMAAVPDGECEHAPKPLHNLFAPLLVAMNNRFGVRFRMENVAARSEIGTKLLKVVYLAVKDDPDSRILVRHRLMTRRREIDHGQTAVTQRHILRRSGNGKSAGTRVVRTAMTNRSAMVCRRRRETNLSENAAHEVWN